MLTILAFVVTIVIVAFHEWGHFLAMRAFGVRVLTFPWALAGCFGARTRKGPHG